MARVSRKVCRGHDCRENVENLGSGHKLLEGNG